MPLTSRARAVPAALLLAVVLLVGAGCSSSSNTASGPATTVPTGPTLPPFDPAQTKPPNDVATIRRLYDPVLEPMGLRISRAALVDNTGGTYVASDTGDHLALYVEPIADTRTNEEYVDGLWTVSALISPDVFGRWSGIDSYDICQEPPNSVDSSPEPFPVTQINLSRAASDTIDWANGSLVDLLFASRTQAGFQLVTSRNIRDTEAFKTAEQTARDKAAAANPGLGTLQAKDGNGGNG